MRTTKPLTPITAISLILSAVILIQPGCATSGNIDVLSRRLEPLRVCRAGGKTESITFAQAMAWHHAHEQGHPKQTPAPPPSTSDRKEAGHDDGLCVGVATGYQAIRYAAGRLFPGETPKASDFKLSVAGAMRGVWDVMDLYAGRKLARPTTGQKKMSLESFIFTARRVSAGKTLTFRLRGGLIPPEFFRLKNRGVTCDDPELERLKKRAARKILSTSPEECFERPG